MTMMISPDEMERRECLVGKTVVVELGPHGSIFPLMIEFVDEEGTIWGTDKDGKDWSLTTRNPILQVEHVSDEEREFLLG